MSRTILLTVGCVFLLLLLQVQAHASTIEQDEWSCTNVPVLVEVLDAKTPAAMNKLHGRVKCCGRNLQLVFFTKLYSLEPSRSTAHELIQLMPSSRCEFLSLYMFSNMRKEAFPALGAEERYDQLQAHIWKCYYEVLPALICQEPIWLDRYLVFLYWASENADWAEGTSDIEARLIKCIGKRFVSEKAYVSDVIRKGSSAGR